MGLGIEMSRDRWYVNNLTTEACFLVQAQFTKEEAIEEITRRLVEYYQPERIYLFGSVARGDDGRDSDLDFCAVVPDEIPAEKLPGGEVYSFVSGTGHEKDIVHWRRSDFDLRA